MSRSVHYLLKKCKNFIFAALVIAFLLSLIFIDVLYLKNGLGEDSLTEICQEAILFAISITFWVLSKRFIRYRAAYILIGGFFACMFIRELDQIFDLIFHGAWFYLALPVALCCIFYAFLHKKQTVDGLCHFTRQRSYPMMVAGLICVLVFSRLFGMGELWRGIMGEDFNRLAKNMAEEGSELLGYGFMLLATCSYWLKLKSSYNRRIENPNNH